MDKISAAFVAYTLEKMLELSYRRGLRLLDKQRQELEEKTRQFHQLRATCRRKSSKYCRQGDCPFRQSPDWLRGLLGYASLCDLVTQNENPLAVGRLEERADLFDRFSDFPILRGGRLMPR